MLYVHSSVPGKDAPLEEDPQVPAAAEPPPSDLGFGGVVTRRRGYRLINRDGSFNVRVRKGNWWRTFFSYHTLLTLLALRSRIKNMAGSPSTFKMTGT